MPDVHRAHGSWVRVESEEFGQVQGTPGMQMAGVLNASLELSLRRGPQVCDWGYHMVRAEIGSGLSLGSQNTWPDR